MSKLNGGIIGPDNVPTGAFGSASGVWRLSDVTNYKKQGTWPIALSGHQVDNSCRFNSGSSDYLNRTPSSAGNRRTWTFSCWIKKSDAGTNNDDLFNGGSAGTNHDLIFLRNDNKFEAKNYSSSAFQYQITTNRLFRDVSAWYHLVVAFDSTQGTESNRVKLYVNGVQETSLENANYPSQNFDSNFNNTVIQTFGRGIESGTSSTYRYLKGYASELCWIDGQQLDPTSFGETDSVTNNWVPKDVSGLTFGTNGFYLDFKDSSALGNDVSGNNNDFTVNNLTSIDQSTDTCTNNFATLNPLDVLDDDGRTLSEGNLNFTTSSGNNGNISGTQAVSGSGKWYFETKISAQSGSASSSAKFGIVGIRDLDKSTPDSAGNAYYIYSDGRKEDGANTTNSAHPGYSLNDIVQVALDLDGGNIYFGLNGNWGDNAGNFNQTFANATAFFTSINTSGFWSAYFVKNVTADNTLTLSVNFGSPSYTISSGNVDASGMGNFEYAVPSGYYSICTRNLNLIG